uniref:Uncharacterized protein n=1 Tax=Myoviridae sp. ctNQV2 TaxID=2827683 RepID=A0A8S5RZH9_9CAUD|nr:MAG TPA: hypothetical protein [Myoviridae sp. ctNQV2]
MTDNFIFYLLHCLSYYNNIYFKMNFFILFN